MKIGMMGAWNTDSGASIHAEFVGRGWKKLGHAVKVFSFYKHSFHGTAIVGEDEDYVTRCFTVWNGPPPRLDPVPFLTSDFEFFVTQDLGMLPKDELGKIFHWIKKRAKTITVIHDGKLAEDPGFYQFDWDAIVCFDKRYKEFLARAYPEERIHIIPYPCRSLEPGDRRKAREELNLPQDKKIVFLFGPAAKNSLENIPAIIPLKDKYPVMLLVVTRDREGIKGFGELKANHQIEVELREESPDIHQLYKYLWAADALLLTKKPAGWVVISSTVFQCLGAGCPIVAFNSDFVELFDKELMKFSNHEQLKENLIDIFEQKSAVQATLKAAEKYVKANSGEEIAKKFLKFFENI